MMKILKYGPIYFILLTLKNNHDTFYYQEAKRSFELALQYNLKDIELYKQLVQIFDQCQMYEERDISQRRIQMILNSKMINKELFAVLIAIYYPE